MTPKPIIFAVKTIICALLVVLASCASAEAGLHGFASWYGGKFHGRMTSSGETFDTNELTAAHRTLPFGTMVKVTNLANGKSVVVKINDRGPFVDGRIIDLSRAAASELDMLGMGVAEVSLEIVDFASPRELFAIQIGAFGLSANAERARAALEAAGFIVTMEKTPLGIARVSVRAIAAGDLEGVRKKLEGLGYDGYIVKREKTETLQAAVTTP
jgi:rare lipoprotein A